MPPVYKGNLGPVEQPVRRIWRKGQGWQTELSYRGRLYEVEGIIHPLTTFCKQIVMEDDGIYATITGQLDGYFEGGDETTGRGEDVWELGYNETDISIYQCENAKIIEDITPGALQIVRAAVKEFEEETPASDITATFVPDSFTGLGGALSLATRMFNLIIRGVDQVKIFSPVVSRTFTVGRFWSGSVSVPGQPTKYANTGAFAAAAQLPSSIFFSLPSGMWLEHPHQVREIVGERTEISQRWEWYNEIDDFLY
jgi:hypothetical protein